MTQHKWKPTTLNHGTMQCEYCHCTEREAAFALGMECSSAPATPPTPATDEREAVAVAALINALKQAGGYPATISHLKSGKFSDSISVRIAIAAIMDASAAEILAAEARGREVEAAAIMDWLCDTYDPDDEHDERLDIAQAIEVVRHIKHGAGK